MECAWVWSKRSTCERLHVGAVLSREGRILVTGYNGSPTSAVHCDHADGEFCNTAVHAEANLIAFAAKWGVETNGADIHVTHMPCRKCAELLCNAGIRSVKYDRPYRDTSGVDLLHTLGVHIERFTEWPDHE
jgi:dCMP deaminase